jgi:N-acetylmuramoyl-L-alanine amidase
VYRIWRNSHAAPSALVLALLAACAPRVTAPAPEPEPAVGLPAIPRVDGPLEVRVTHPTPETQRPRSDSSFVYGSVGTGAASLTINGTSVDVAPNGAFLAFLPVPADGRYELTAQARGQTARTSVSYRPPPAAPVTPAAPVETVAFPQPRAGTVTGGADTLATGSDVAIGRTAPGGSVYRWFLPRGARVVATGQRGDQLRVRLDSTTTAWFPASAVNLGASVPAPGPTRVGITTARADSAWVDVRIPAAAAPFLVQTDSGFAVTLYGVSAPAPVTPLELAGDPLLAGGTWTAPAPGVARLSLQLKQPLWGYKAFYDTEGALVLRLRRPPAIDPNRPLRGLRIVVDPGHPPAGATGATGLTEAEANLNISLQLAERLRAAGAEPILTRTENVAVSLAERVNLAVAQNAHLLISVHNNAFPEGVNPFRNHGTSTYYFHSHAARLARALDQEIVAFTRIPDLGARQGNLALVRPTWMPAVLTESLFMPIPEQEAALRSPGFGDRLAAAHVRGIETFLRQVATQ